MKTIVPLMVALTMLTLLCLLQMPETNDTNRSPVASKPEVITSVANFAEAPSPSASKYSIPDSGRKTGPRSVKVSEWAIRKTADDEIARLKQPLKSLFQRWGLDDGALSDALGLIHDKRVQAGLALNQRVDELAGSNSHEADKLYQRRHSAIATHYEAEMMTILGSLQRLFEMTTLVTQVSQENYKANVPAMKAQSEQIKQWIAAEVAEIKAAHGTNYQEVMRKRFGEAATAAMLQQSGSVADD